MGNKKEIPEGRSAVFKVSEKKENSISKTTSKRISDRRWRGPVRNEQGVLSTMELGHIKEFMLDQQQGVI